MCVGVHGLSARGVCVVTGQRSEVIKPMYVYACARESARLVAQYVYWEKCKIGTMCR